MIPDTPCARALDVVEAIAAGDLELDAVLRAHFESCPRCSAALASARRLETALAARPAPAAPARFTPTVLSRIRRERWRAEQRVDRLFNVAIAAAALLVVGGIFAMFNVNTLLGASQTTWKVLSTMSLSAVEGAAPSVPIYIGSAGLLVSALAMWWWAERRMTL
jgi:anti-sigma factor RsiW